MSVGNLWESSKKLFDDHVILRFALILRIGTNTGETNGRTKSGCRPVIRNVDCVCRIQAEPAAHSWVFAPPRYQSTDTDTGENLKTRAVVDWSRLGLYLLAGWIAAGTSRTAAETLVRRFRLSISLRRRSHPGACRPRRTCRQRGTRIVPEAGPLCPATMVLSITAQFRDDRGVTIRLPGPALRVGTELRGQRFRLGRPVGRGSDRVRGSSRSIVRAALSPVFPIPGCA